MIRIAILGPESTGKSTLAKELAEFYHSPWVPEYARVYVEQLTRPYVYEDICTIAHKQIEEEEFYNLPNKSSIPFVFFDTDLIITKVWFEYKYSQVPEFVVEQLKKNFFDFYLLCAPDLPWESDPVREHGNDRDYFFNWYKSEIEQTEKPFVIVEGIGNQRIQNAVNAINQLFNN